MLVLLGAVLMMVLFGASFDRVDSSALVGCGVGESCVLELGRRGLTRLLLRGGSMLVLCFVFKI